VELFSASPTFHRLIEIVAEREMFPEGEKQNILVVAYCFTILIVVYSVGGSQI